jgi:multidrug efflux system membrane fusion protein
MKIRRRTIVSTLIGVLVIGATATFILQTQQPQAQRSGGRFRGGADGPVPVLVAPAKTADVPIYLDGVGTTRALNTVTVKAQVDGKLSAILFKEGQDVERGFVVATIDPVTYQAQFDQAVAKKAQDEATLANAKIDLERYTKLVATNAVNRQQMDTQKALVAQLEAQVKQDQAAIDNAQAILDYTRITAPISGRTGIRLVDVGNIVHANDTTGIVVITQIKPISMFFTLPQQQLARINKAFSQGPLQVEALGNDNKTIVDRGTLQVVDNQVDQTTGTIKLKAEFPNGDLQLWPGQFVNVRLQIDTLKQVLVIPTAAVQRGPSGAFVYVLRDNNTVAVRQITVSQQDDLQAVVPSGLAASDRVVTTGFARLSDGAAVAIGTPSDTTAPVAPQQQRRRRDRGGEGAVQSEQRRSETQRRSERTSVPVVTGSTQ